MTAEILKTLIAANLAAAGAIVLLLLLGGAIRRAFGARMAYAAWLVVPLAAAATLLPARKVEIASLVPQVRPIADATVEVLIVQGPVIDWSLLAIAAWATGAVVLIGLTIWTQTRTLGLIGRLTPEDGRLRAANPAIGPAIVGIFRPRIMVPADFERRFDADEQAVIIAHEETHLAGGDQRINALVELCRCLFWFNPFVHLAARRLRIDQELACDAAVIARFPKARRTYAEALLKTQTASAPLPLGCYWPERSHKRLKERLTMLTHKTPGRARRLAGAACLAALGLGTGYAAWAAAPEAALAPIPIAAPAITNELFLEPAPLPSPAPAPQQSAPTLTNSQPAAPVAPQDTHDEMRSFSLRLAPPAEGEEGTTNRMLFVRREGPSEPLPPGAPPEAALLERLSGGSAMRIECLKSNDGPLTCKRNGQLVEGEELEMLRAALPRLAPGAEGSTAVAGRRLIHLDGASEDRTMTIFQGRRLPE